MHAGTDRNDLELRLAAATDEDTSRGLNYTTLFGLVRDHLGEEAADAARMVGPRLRAGFPVAMI